MESVNIDSIIPYMTFGAVSIASVFFTIYYYYIKDETFKKYRNYLLLTLGYILIKEFIVIPKYSQKPITFYIIGEVFYWGGLIQYIRFIYFTIDFKENKKLFNILYIITQLLHVLAFFLYMIFQLLLPEYKNIYIYFFIPISIYVFVIICLFAKYLYEKRIVIYFKYLYVGSILFMFFNTLGLYFNTPSKNFYGLTNFSILCIGWFLELMMFMIALCMKAKYEWDEKISIVQRNTSIERTILIHEIEKQKAIYESRHTERLKISVDIHDGISNAITGLKFFINDKKIQTTDIKEKKMFGDLENEVNSIYIQVRNYIQQLYSDENENTNDILYYLFSLQSQYKNSLLKINLNVDTNLNSYLNKFQLNEFYFILNEIIGNAIKHSECNQISVTITFSLDTCFFSIKDNGKGFDYDLVLNSGLGLSSIKNRINKLYGTIQYSHFEGTLVSGNFPHFSPPLKEGGYNTPFS